MTVTCCCLRSDILFFPLFL